VGMAAVLLVGAGLAAVAAVVETRRADDARNRAVAAGAAADARAHEIAFRNAITQADALRATQRDLAALLALGAYDLAPGPPTFGALLGTVTAAPAFDRSTPMPVQQVTNVSFVPARHAAVVADDHFALSLIDLDTGAKIASLPAPLDGADYLLTAPDADGRSVAVAATDGTRTV